ncbi:Oidioi.mRNA.OKI2018_I69.chr1.g68.t2.cds [Oikopleura dioica]|uniref:Oidioi.mRNA.OKI2018_I69.chr1.g68.t2.cds n=1 Tax=Oikopleura dioica TaxID=34765 RepID=A0ABN7SNW2_OIKDI|nr:Oidioi.mRNA.OKI2018_I69.chr1.g68.t2.cds [Oikopleura dioica]
MKSKSRASNFARDKRKRELKTRIRWICAAGCVLFFTVFAVFGGRNSGNLESRKRRQAPETSNVTWSDEKGDPCPSFNDTAGCIFAFVEDYKDDLGFLSDTCARVIREGRIDLNETADEIEICSYEKSTIPGLWLAFYCIAILWLFVAVAIICDDFFVPSLEAISEKLDLSEDVAGATFMAAGSSAPELFTSLLGVTKETDVGVGTIVGSAVFNLLVIVALSAALAGKSLNLDWRPLARDATYYAISIGFLVGFAWDGYITWWEALILTALYVIYVVIMAFNPHAFRRKTEPADVLPEKRRSSLVGSQFRHTRPGEMTGAVSQRRNTSIIRNQSIVSKGKIEPDERHQELDEENLPTSGRDSGIDDAETVIERNPEARNSQDEVLKEDDEEEEELCHLCPCWSFCPGVPHIPPKLEEKTPIGILKFIGSIILFIMSFPFYVFYTFTIPRCDTDENRKWYLLSFIMCIAWIVALTYGMVTVVEHAGCILGIGHFTMGLVIIAVGTSLPDALSSILVARDGFGDMAVSNAIGSNVFDIDLGIGAPFFIFALVRDKPVSLLKPEEWCEFNSFTGKKIMPHSKFGLVLLGILTIAIIIFAALRFKLDKRVGVALLLLYACFLAYAFTQEILCHSLSC